MMIIPDGGPDLVTGRADGNGYKIWVNANVRRETNNKGIRTWIYSPFNPSYARMARPPARAMGTRNLTWFREQSIALVLLGVECGFCEIFYGLSTAFARSRSNIPQMIAEG